MPEQIQVWEKDPASGKLISAPKPDVAKQPFGFIFQDAEPEPDPDPDSVSFRYWNAAEALRRGADFWAPALAPKTYWNFSTPADPLLAVTILNVGDTWNSGYAGNELVFGRGQLNSGAFIHAAESADLVCHELGHAILDTAQPLLWDLTNDEATAFHEAFGDLSAILCALQVESIRTAVLAAKGGNIFCSSPLSRIAVKFGSALHTFAPEDAEADCLRNAYNPFCYTSFDMLPADGVASELKAKAHSFSRIFTGALLKILSGMLATHPPGTSAQLQQVTLELRDIVIQAAKAAPVVPLYYAALAAKMVAVATNRNPSYQKIFKDVFVERLILSPDSPIESHMDIAGTGEEIQPAPKLVSVSFPDHGIDQSIIVAVSADPSRSKARNGMVKGQSLAPQSAEETARIFVERLLTNGLLDISSLNGEELQPAGRKTELPPAPITHRLERIDNQLHLKRVRFLCSHCVSALRCS